MDLLERCKMVYAELNYELGWSCLGEIKHAIQKGQEKFPNDVHAQQNFAVNFCRNQMENRHDLLPMEWIAELKKVAVETLDFAPQAAETLDFDAYISSYYFQNESPYNALMEDMSYA